MSDMKSLLLISIKTSVTGMINMFDKVVNNLLNYRVMLFFKKEICFDNQPSEEVVISIRNEREFSTYKVSDEIRRIIVRELNNGSDIKCHIINNQITSYACFSRDRVVMNEIGIFITPTVNTTYLYNIYVSKEFRGKGLQKILINSVEKSLQKDSQLIIAVLSDNFHSLNNIINCKFEMFGFLKYITILGRKKITLSNIKRGYIEY